jgi:predicted anti-sigma-YlaC factor YlaD
MSTCKYEIEIERWFDGESTSLSNVEAHIEECTSCAQTLELLKLTRQGVEALSSSQEIGDAQIPAFLEGIHTGIGSGSTVAHRSRWAFLSLAAAAIIVTMASISVIPSGPETVKAETEIESVTTDIEGATTELFHTDNDTPTAWVNIPDGDLW